MMEMRMTEQEEKSTIYFEDLLQEFQTRKGWKSSNREENHLLKACPSQQSYFTQIVALGIMVIILKI